MADARHILRISGSDANSFLQGLVTNDVDKVRDGLVYAALLTPQGRTSCWMWTQAWLRP